MGNCIRRLFEDPYHCPSAPISDSSATAYPSRPSNRRRSNPAPGQISNVKGNILFTPTHPAPPSNTAYYTALSEMLTSNTAPSTISNYSSRASRRGPSNRYLFNPAPGKFSNVKGNNSFTPTQPAPPSNTAYHTARSQFPIANTAPLRSSSYDYPTHRSSRGLFNRLLSNPAPSRSYNYSSRTSKRGPSNRCLFSPDRSQFSNVEGSNSLTPIQPASPSNTAYSAVRSEFSTSNTVYHTARSQISNVEGNNLFTPKQLASPSNTVYHTARS